MTVREGTFLRLEGKTAVVTGCARPRGFGRAIARRLAKEGANVLLTDISQSGNRVVASAPDPEGTGLDRAVAEIERMGRRAICAVMDVRSRNAVFEAMDLAVSTFGRLDILVNNAAAAPGADRVPMIELAEEAWDVVIDTNLKGPFLCAQAAARIMLKQDTGGCIINIASTSAKIGYQKMSAYCASKAGVLGLSRALALELAPTRIRVNAICPGVADTDRIDYVGMHEDGSFDAELRATRLRGRAATIPLGRVALPEDVAGVAAFLASDDAAYLTGEFINVAGGYVMD